MGVKEIHNSFRVAAFCLCAKKSLARNNSFESAFHLQVQFHVNQTHFRVEGCERAQFKTEAPVYGHQFMVYSMKSPSLGRLY